MRVFYRGFTLIELLVVITILGILAGVLITVLNPIVIYKQGKDVDRKADLEKIASALEQYFADNSSYPTSLYTPTSPCPSSGSLTSSDGKITYIQKIPCDPSHSSYNGGSYYYMSNVSCYVLGACLEDTSASGNNIGNYTALNNAVTTCAIGGSMPTLPASTTCSSNKYYIQTNL